MYSYALSLSYRLAEDPKWFEAVMRSKVRKFEFVAVGSDPPEAYARAVDNILAASETLGIQAASVHIPFGVTPWVAAREGERAEALAALRGLMKAWAPLRPPRYTLHGGSEADKAIPHQDQIRALRADRSTKVYNGPRDSKENLAAAPTDFDGIPIIGTNSISASEAVYSAA